MNPSSTRRIGVIVPSTNLTVESDFHRTLPDNITFHTHRLWIPPGEMTEQHLETMNEGLLDAARLLGSAGVHCIAYACTSGSFFRGREWDAEASQTIARVAGVPAFTTSHAVTAAIKHRGASVLSVATPYPRWTNERLAAYLGASGFSVLNVDGDEAACAGGHGTINERRPETVVRFASSIVHDDADLLVCSCTAWRAMEAAAPLEQMIDRPVVTSNQATIWYALTLLGTGPNEASTAVGQD